MLVTVIVVPMYGETGIILVKGVQHVFHKLAPWLCSSAAGGGKVLGPVKKLFSYSKMAFIGNVII